MNLNLKKCATVRGLFLFIYMLAAPVLAAPDAKVIDFWQDHEPASRLRVDHGAWQLLLDSYLNSEHPSGVHRFQYAQVSSEDRARLNDYMAMLQRVEPRQLNRDEQFAYWVNFYNAATVQLILDNKPRDSIRDIRSGAFTPGPWRKKFFSVVGQKLSLDDIEHGILRPIWKDPRIHYVVNCASLGCPNLFPTAFTAENYEAQSELAAREFINHPRAVTISAKQIKLSSLYSWYATDFGADLPQILAHMSQYAKPQLAEQIKQASQNGSLKVVYDYDWRLNKNE